MQLDAFTALPRPNNQDGAPRRIGVEIEMGGISEGRAARIARDVLGGTVAQGEDTLWTVRDSDIGDLDIYLDASFRKADKSALRDAAIRVGREVIPIELVTGPLAPDDLPRLEEVICALREAGALGSSAGLFFGFGIHFNIELASDRVSDIRDPLLAYALIEDWMRATYPIDETRRVLPFTAPYPTEFVRELIGAGPGVSLTDLAHIYVAHNATRNRGLDMLPILTHRLPDPMARLMPSATSARPTFHFRLPDCRIDEPGWTLSQEWERWVVVEQVAQNDDLMDRLSAAWLDNHGAITLIRQGWATRAAEIMQQYGINGGTA